MYIPRENLQDLLSNTNLPKRSSDTEILFYKIFIFMANLRQTESFPERVFIRRFIVSTELLGGVTDIALVSGVIGAAEAIIPL